MISEAVAKHAGLVMAHAAVIASVLEPGELICPFIVITKGSDRQSIAFESKTQDEAVDRAWSSLSEYKTFVDLWAMAREGLVAGETGKEDVLVVAAWEQGMSEAVVFTQRFLPEARGGFAIYGPISVQYELKPDQLQMVGEWLLQGIGQHPKGERWQSWFSLDNGLESGATN
jgi:hypothetical protein